jgi:malate dehydrogenase (oxaloacetate-decarboxylating)(NADP+)
MAMISYSNFGSDKTGSPAMMHQVVEQLQTNFPDMVVDGEMQLNFALNNELRDKKYPFTRMFDKKVNTLIFPNLSSANSCYQILQSMGEQVEVIGPIQMGLNKPIHFTDAESTVREIVNVTAVAVIDAIVESKKNQDL